MMNDPKETYQGQQNQERNKQNQLDPNKKPNPANQNEQKRRWRLPTNVASGGLLPEPALHRITINQDALARITQVALAPEVIHVMRDDLA